MAGRRRFLRDWLLRPLGFRFIAKVNVSGLEHVPTSGPTLLCMNHIATVDPVIITGVVNNRFVVPISKVENFKIPLIGFIARAWGAIPVHREQIDRKALKNTIDLLKAEQPVLIAPEGTREPAIKQVKEGFVYVALKTGATVVPVGLEGTQRVGKDLLRLRRTPIEVRFGRPFRFRVEGQTGVPRETMHIMAQEAMYQLAHLVNEERRGDFADLSKSSTDWLEFIDS